MPKSIGKVAHITAASPGGPRYDEQLTSAERRAESNLILLCGDHHDAIDSQLEFHTAKWLREAKKRHVETLQRGSRYAMGAVGYQDLQMICDALARGVTLIQDGIESIEPAVDIDAKIKINDLGAEARELIELGMAQDKEVRTFLATMDRMLVDFSGRLTSRFKALYFQGVADGLIADELFQNILGAAYENCGPRLTPESKAAALAVVAYLFSICEIFEHEPAAAR